MLITFSGLTTVLHFDKIVGMIPLFKSHYSIGKSILTLDDPITHKEGGSDSVFSIAVENKLKEVVFVEDSLTGFLQAKKNADNLNLKLIFGLRIDMRENASIDPKEESVKSSHKIILFARDAEGCKLLNTIYSEAFTKHRNCVDHKVLKKHWNDDHLVLAIPFYDSFIYNNLIWLYRTLIRPYRAFNKVLIRALSGLVIPRKLVICKALASFYEGFIATAL